MSSYEELDVWVEGCRIAAEVYQLTNQGGFLRDFGLSDQIRRSAVSIPSNIAEGKERETINELIRFLYIAKGSAAELRTQLLIAHKIGYIDEQTYSRFLETIIGISGRLGSFIKTLKRRESDKSARKNG